MKSLKPLSLAAFCLLAMATDPICHGSFVDSTDPSNPLPWRASPRLPTP